MPTALLKSRAVDQPQRRRFTRAEYHQMADLGMFEGQRVELIDGEVIYMAAQRDLHAFALRLIDHALRSALGAEYVYYVQMPMVIGDSEPEPDFAVARSELRKASRHPRTAALVIEVTDTSLEYDRTDKASLYASAGIEDYWVINLVEMVVEVHRKPTRDRAASFKHSYASTTVFRKGQTISPLTSPKAKVLVKDLLP